MAVRVGDIHAPAEFWTVEHNGRVTDVYHLKCPKKPGFHVKMKPMEGTLGLRCPDCGRVINQ